MSDYHGPVIPPTFYDLLTHAQGERSVAEISPYIPADYEQTTRRCELAGVPAFRRLLMNTIGATRQPEQANYRLQTQDHGFMAGATDFITTESVGNENEHNKMAQHLGVFGVMVGDAIVTPGVAMANSGLGLIALAGLVNVGTALLSSHFYLVPLQRYNRARLMRVMDARLVAGHAFHPDYVNLYGIDNRAIARYYNSAQDLLQAEARSIAPDFHNASIGQPNIHST
jgi:hypothetical protein